MLDIKQIRDNPAEVKQRLLAKGGDFSAEIDRILELDQTRRDLIYKTETLKAEQNKVSKQIPAMKRAGEDTAPVFAKMKELSETVKQTDLNLRKVEEDYQELLLGLPNLLDPDLKPGGKENNEPLRVFGTPHVFDFPPKNHVDLCTDLNLIDYPRGAKLSGAGFWIYRGIGARLEWALLNYFIDTHLQDGYELVLVPHMLGYECGLTAGQFPKFQDDVYWLESAEEERRRFLLPTAETALVSLHRDEIIPEADLPLKYISYTPCFRREAGSYRAD
jgi:seryl-tRNA synthetase